MAWKPHSITDTELALLRLLWRDGPSTIRELTDELYEERTQSQYATVQSLLDRLANKDCVERTRAGRANIYTATVSRAELVARRMRDTADALCDGSLAPLLTHLVRISDPTPEETEALEKMIERLADEADVAGQGGE